MSYSDCEQSARRDTAARLASIDDKAVVKISVRSVYGNPTIYPVNNTARLFADIAGTKTLLLSTLAKAKQLGFRLEQVQDPSAQAIYLPGLQNLLIEA